MHAFVFDKKKEATVRLLENPETEIEIKSPGKSAAKVNGERKCDGDCGGKGLCKEREAKEKEYAF